VLVEKGMAPTLADAQKLVSCAQAANRSLCVAQNYRYQSMERTVARMIADPSHRHYAGAPFLIEYTQNRQRPHPRTLDYPFASVWDMSCHHFDTLLSWLGLGFLEVNARAFGPAWSRYTFPNNTSLQIAHDSGCMVHYLHTHNAAFNEVRVRVQAERGAILVEGDQVSFCPRGDVQLQHEPVVAVSPEPHAGELGVLADFHRHCVQGEPVGISGAANLSVMALCDATCRSAESGRTVTVG
jgi:predicted dehydrogenase